MEALSCHLMWVAAATYCALLAPKNLLATLIGVLGMAHFSLGRGSGSFFGGFLIGEVGTRDAFRYMGLVAVAGGLAYKFIHAIWLRKYDNPVSAIKIMFLRFNNLLQLCRMLMRTLLRMERRKN